MSTAGHQGERSQDDLVLYMRPDCPYCAQVLAAMEELGRKLPQRDVKADPEAKEALRALGGKTQVPCLVIAGKPMYESKAIIDYLRRDGNGGP